MTPHIKIIRRWSRIRIFIFSFSETSSHRKWEKTSLSYPCKVVTHIIIFYACNIPYLLKIILHIMFRRTHRMRKTNSINEIYRHPSFFQWNIFKTKCLDNWRLVTSYIVTLWVLKVIHYDTLRCCKKDGISFLQQRNVINNSTLFTSDSHVYNNLKKYNRTYSEGPFPTILFMDI